MVDVSWEMMRGRREERWNIVEQGSISEWMC